MKFYLYLFAFLSGLLFLGCSHCDITKIEKKLIKQDQNINSVARDKFNSKFKTINNQSGNFALVIDNFKDSKSPVVNKQSFFIFDLTSNEVIFEDEVVNAKVFWESNNLVTVSRIPGMIKKDSETKEGHKIYSFDVLEKKKK
jgi:hypothetical protein